MSAPGNEPRETPQSGPWADDIRAALGEEHADAYDIVDAYMRDNVQPRMTQLEQDLAPARELWSDLEKDSDQAIYELVVARYGDEFAETYRELHEHEREPAPEPTPAAETPLAAPTALNDEDREVVAWAREKREAEQKDARTTEYDAFKKELGEKHKLTERDIGLLDPFIYASPEDPDAAVAAYRAWKTEAGVPDPEPETVPEPPAVLGGEASSTVPPVNPQYTKFSDLDDAVGDFLAEQRATRTPPPVMG